MMRPLELVRKSDNGKLELCAQGLEQLQAMRGPLRVICVAGPARTGKSFLLNCIAESQGLSTQCFDVGNTVEACTRGIWMWTSAASSTILLDTEGLGHTGSDANHDIPIFTLSVLLSSAFIFNSKGALSESTLDSLSVVAKLAQRVAGNAGGRDLNEIFPHFVLLLRDFHLQLQQDGVNVSATSYLESSLEHIDGGNSSRNCIREVMRSTFQTRKCFALPIPTAGDFQNLTLDKCTPKFQHEMGSLTEFLAARAPGKSFGGRMVNGKHLVGLLNSWVEAINKGAVPNIFSALETVIGTLHKETMDDACRVYEQNMQGAEESSSEHTLMLLHHEACAKAKHVLNVSSSGDEEEDRTLQGKLEKLTEQKLQALKARVAERSGARCTELIPESLIQASDFSWDNFTSNYPSQEFAPVTCLMEAAEHWRSEAAAEADAHRTTTTKANKTTQEFAKLQAELERARSASASGEKKELQKRELLVVKHQQELTKLQTEVRKAQSASSTGDQRATKHQQQVTMLQAELEQAQSACASVELKEGQKRELLAAKHQQELTRAQSAADHRLEDALAEADGKVQEAVTARLAAEEALAAAGEEQEEEEEVEAKSTPGRSVYDRQTVPALRKLLQSRGEEIFGSKDELVQRCVKSDETPKRNTPKKRGATPEAQLDSNKRKRTR